MKKTILITLAALLTGGALFAGYITRDGETVTPTGAGTVVLDAGTFEAFPLPDYAARFVTDDYKSYFVEVDPGIKVHVLEVGQGYPVLLQHGNPTSGFLYRKVAAELPLDRVRLIMPTLVGLGFSSKIPASEHNLDDHMRRINSVLTQLDLKDVILVGQDWGGPAGMGAVALSPGMLKGAVIMNTGLNAPKEAMDISRIHAIVKTPVVGEFIIETLNSAFDGIPRVQGDPASIPPEIIELYKRPVLDSGNKKAPLAMMRMVTDGPDHPSAERMRFIGSYVQTLDIPVELIWGMNDPILAKALPNMKQNFPDAHVTETEAGHFLQEEVPAEIAAAILRVLDQIVN
ncbi:MAG: alpha/beta fold hydrolase [Parvularculales bacterium]